MGAAPRKTKQRSSKSMQIFLCYSNTKSTLLVSLTLNRVEKAKHKNFGFVHLLSSSSSSSSFFTRHNSKSIRSLRILNIPNDCSANLLHSYLFWGSCELRVASYCLKNVPKMLRVFMGMLVNFSHDNCGGVAHIHVVRPHLDYWARAVQAATSLLASN